MNPHPKLTVGIFRQPAGYRDRHCELLGHGQRPEKEFVDPPDTLLHFVAGQTGPCGAKQRRDDGESCDGSQGRG